MVGESKTGVLFVCLGNICRSPLAEGVFLAELARRGLEREFHVDSCGTGGWHVGEPPDPRSVEVAGRHGVDISGQRSRKLATSDYDAFKWIIAMDRSNHRDIVARSPADSSGHIVSFMPWVPEAPTPDVPDPYYGGPGGFDHVYDLLERGMAPLLDAILEAESP
ncbi:MAG: low molecular weight protein-tyrosine-phosphatase [Myxococcota bacterium]